MEPRKLLPTELAAREPEERAPAWPVLTRGDVIRRIAVLGADAHGGGAEPLPALEGFENVVFRRAAVLVPIVERPAGLTVLLTRRADHLAEHAGQVSFPGGRIEASDRDAEHAALREAFEEIGLDESRVTIIGRLPLYHTSSNFEVVPVVGLVTPPFAVAPDPSEVAEIFEVPLGFVLDPANRERRDVMWRGRPHFYYRMPYQGWEIWGATAGMLISLADALAETQGFEPY